MPSPEQTPTASPVTASLLPLTPSFESAEHEVYLKALSSAVGDQESHLWNIALTGAYGTGKSSILERFRDSVSGRAIEVALSSLGGSPDDKTVTGASPAVTNTIQKEIVKQLLYRRHPRRMRGSRYRRIEPFRPWGAFLWAVVAAAVFAVVAVFTGITDRIGSVIPSDAFWQWAAYLGAVVGVGGLAFLVQRAVHGVRIEKVGAGSTSITLTAKDTYYFDEYLDEIVYFFQRTGHDIVVFEDIDRFKNPHIFETLRELNTILNHSEQLKNKPIRFIYAIRDSIFTEQPHHDDVDVVTNRTKFFDLVIPVVPFITYQTSRDWLVDHVRTLDSQISLGLINLLAPYVTDMRLLKNIRNEYVIFSSKIFARGGLKELRADSLLAMIVYKNFHLADFEKIAGGTSKLDALYRLSRALVNDNVEDLDESIAEVSSAETATAGDIRLSKRLAEVVRVVSSQWAYGWNGTARAGSATFDETSAENAEFWRELAQNASAVFSGRHSSNAVQMSKSDVETLVGEAITPDKWDHRDEQDREDALTELRARREKVTSMVMSELIADDSFVISPGKDVRTYLTAATEVLGEGVALDLVRAGHIDRNFALYIAAYRNSNLSASAKNFMIRCIDTKTSDPLFRFDHSNDIPDLIADTDGAFLEEPSVLNVQILDYLLANAPERTDGALKLLATHGSTEQFFLTLYVTHGSRLVKLMKQLSAVYPHLYEYLADAAIEPSTQTELLGAALSAGWGINYYTSDTVREMLLTGLEHIPQLTGDADPAAAAAAMHTIGLFHVLVPNLDKLNPAARNVAIEESSYEITAMNLRTAIGGGDLALDDIKAADSTVYDYVLNNLASYMAFVGSTPTVAAAKHFVGIVNDVADISPGELNAVVAGASLSCHVKELDGVATEALPALARNARFLPTWKNVAFYLENVDDEGGLDPDLATLLESAKAIFAADDVDAEERKDLAVRVMNSGDLGAEAKVSITKSLKIRSIGVSELKPADDDLFARLLDARLIEDDADAFQRLESATWQAREQLVKASRAFPSYVGGLSLSASEIERLATSAEILAPAKQALLDMLAADASDFTATAIRGLADFVEASRSSIDSRLVARMAAAGAPAKQVIAILARTVDAEPAEAILPILGALGGNYAAIAEQAHQTVIPDSWHTRAVLHRLNELLVVSSYKPLGKYDLRVYMKRP